MQGLFEDGMQQFVSYQRDDTDKKTRKQKKREKVQKMLSDLKDPEKKKQRHKVRRQQEKAKLQKQLEGLTEEEARIYLDKKKSKKKETKEKLLDALKNGMPILIDIVYEKQMNLKENKSLATQIELIMKSIKHTESPPGIHLCSVGGFAKAQLERMGYQYWTLTSSEEDVLEVSKKMGKNPVYLSPDAPEPLTKIDPECSYIIGGLVDRTVIKNASMIRARNLDIPAYHLPIKQMMRNRSCLNLDHVVMILCKFRQTGDWNIAFEYGAPKRWKKSAQKQEQEQEQGNQSGSEEDLQKQQKQQEEKSEKIKEEKEQIIQ